MQQLVVQQLVVQQLDWLRLWLAAPQLLECFAVQLRASRLPQPDRLLHIHRLSASRC